MTSWGGGGCSRTAPLLGDPNGADRSQDERRKSPKDRTWTAAKEVLRTETTAEKNDRLQTSLPAWFSFFAGIRGHDLAPFLVLATALLQPSTLASNAVAHAGLDEL